MPENSWWGLLLQGSAEALAIVGALSVYFLKVRWDRKRERNELVEFLWHQLDQDIGLLTNHLHEVTSTILAAYDGKLRNVAFSLPPQMTICARRLAELTPSHTVVFTLYCSRHDIARESLERMRRLIEAHLLSRWSEEDDWRPGSVGSSGVSGQPAGHPAEPRRPHGSGDPRQDLVDSFDSPAIPDLDSRRKFAIASTGSGLLDDLMALANASLKVLDTIHRDTHVLARTSEQIAAAQLRLREEKEWIRSRNRRRG